MLLNCPKTSITRNCAKTFNAEILLPFLRSPVLDNDYPCARLLCSVWCMDSINSIRLVSLEHTLILTNKPRGMYGYLKKQLFFKLFTKELISVPVFNNYPALEGTKQCCSCSAALKNSVLLKTCYDNKLLVLVYSSNKSPSEQLFCQEVKLALASFQDI